MSAKVYVATATELEHVLDDKEMLGRFYEFLSSIFSTESFDFWLEAEMYRHLDEAALPAKADLIFKKYFGDNPESPLNVDDPTIDDEVRNRMSKPGKDTFLRAQSLVWGLLKFECFARFKASPQFGTPLTKKQKSDLKKSKIGSLISDWVSYYKKAKKKGLDLHIGEGAEPVPAKPPLLDRLYDLPDIEEIFDDEEMFFAFREYLYRQFANENLTFWIETELFRHLTSESERKKRVKEIWEKFCVPEAPMPVNIDFNARKLIQTAMPSSPATTFRDAERMTWKVLKNEWFPEFCASDVFKECNEGSVEYKRSSIQRERGNSVDMYHELVAVKARVEKAGRDFIKEINEEPEHLKAAQAPKMRAPPISPKVANGELAAAAASAVGAGDSPGSPSSSTSPRTPRDKKHKDKSSSKDKDKKDKPSRKSKSPRSAEEDDEDTDD